MFSEHKSGIDPWNRKAVRGKKEHARPFGSSYRGYYSKSAWASVPSNVNLSDFIPGRAAASWLSRVIGFLTGTVTQTREVTTGDYQDLLVYEYDSVYDIENGEKVNEQIIYSSEASLGIKSVPTNHNVREEIESRTCYLGGALGC